MAGLWKNWLWDLPVGGRTLGDWRPALPDGVACGPTAWVDPCEVHDLSSNEVLVDAEGLPLAWHGAEPAESAPRMQAKHSFFIRQPWELLKAVEASLQALTEPGIEVQGGEEFQEFSYLYVQPNH